MQKYPLTASLWHHPTLFEQSLEMQKPRKLRAIGVSVELVDGFEPPTY
jgi:hypothetical protein